MPRAATLVRIASTIRVALAPDNSLGDERRDSAAAVKVAILVAP